MSDSQSFSVQTMAQVREQFDKIAAQAYPEANARQDFSVALGYSERCAEQAMAMLELSVWFSLFNFASDAAYLAGCAYALARNSVQVLETGWNDTSYTDWLAAREERRKK